MVKNDIVLKRSRDMIEDAKEAIEDFNKDRKVRMAKQRALFEDFLSREPEVKAALVEGIDPNNKKKLEKALKRAFGRFQSTLNVSRNLIFAKHSGTQAKDSVVGGAKVGAEVGVFLIPFTGPLAPITSGGVGAGIGALNVVVGQVSGEVFTESMGLARKDAEEKFKRRVLKLKS